MGRDYNDVDVFIGNHSWQNDTRGNYEKSLTCEENPFIDDTRWGAFLEKTEQTMLRIMREESRTQFINYAHRGASGYAPENTLLSFNLGVFMGANGIETDVHMTKDGVPVLFHDDTLKRVTGEEGSIERILYLAGFYGNFDGEDRFIFLTTEANEILLKDEKAEGAPNTTYYCAAVRQRG